jgi:hypothetical protein
MELSRQTMKKIDGLATGKSFWLKQSLYAGPFYDDDRFTLLHASSFDELTYLKMPDGATILPPKPSFIIPVGTRVTITAIEWPDWNNFVKRPIFTPRHLPWMKMTVAMQRGQVSLMRPETFIFLLPVESDNSRHFESWFLSIFSDKDTNPWLLGLKPEVQNAVLGKRAMAGMSREALRAALGDPGSKLWCLKTEWSRKFKPSRLQHPHSSRAPIECAKTDLPSCAVGERRSRARQTRHGHLDPTNLGLIATPSVVPRRPSHL